MKRLIFLLLIAATVMAEGELVPVLTRDFSAGLNTRANNIPLGAGRVVHNFDLTKNFGALTLRDGFDSVFSFPGCDSFLWNGLFSGKYSDGNKQLFAILDSNGVGYANIYASDLNTINFGVTDSFLLTPDGIDSAFDTTFGISSIDTITDTTCLDCTQRKPTGTCVEWTEVTCIAGGEGNDSVAIVATIDTTFGAVTSIDTTLSQAWWEQIIVGSDTCLDSFVVDSHFTLSDVVDTFVTKINAGSCAGSVTASRLDSTLVIIEDSDAIFAEISHSATFTLVNSGSITPTHRIATKFAATGIPKWTTYRDRVYIVNGASKGRVFDGRYSYWLPLRSPGEPEVIPLNTPGNPNGTYRYVLKSLDGEVSATDTLRTNHFGFIGTPIIANDQQVLLSGFPPPNIDTFHVQDSVNYQIWRSVGDIGRVDRLDSLWVLDTVAVDSSSYKTFTFIDNVSDVDLRTRTGNSGQLLIDTGFYRWIPDSVGTQKYTHITRPGAPTLISFDSRADSGIWGGDTSTTNWGNVAGWSYGAVLIDTSQNSPSSMGPRFEFYQEREASNYDSACFDCGGGGEVRLSFGRNSVASIRLALPRTTDTNIVVLLYRGAIVATALDSTHYSTPAEDRLRALSGAILPPTIGRTALYADSFAVFSYNLIGQYNPGDTITDTLTFDSLLLRALYRSNNIPPLVDNIMAHDNRLFMSNRNTVFYEQAEGDTGLVFNLMSQAPINKDDGQRILDMWPGKEIVKVAKTGSMYQMFQTAADSWRPFELSAHYGVVSPLSHISAPEGDYFLSGDGVRLEVEGLNKSRSFVGSLVSSQLKSFDNFTTATLQGAVAAYIDNKYLLSFPAIGTTFVANKLFSAEGQRLSWTTWGMTFAGWAQYGVGASNELLPDDTGYFIKSNSTSLYRYGASTSDNGTFIQGAFKSGDLFPVDGFKYAVRDVGLLVSSTDTVDQSWVLNMYDGLDNLDLTLRYLYNRLDTTRYHFVEQPDTDPSVTWAFSIGANPAVGNVGVTIFQGLDITFIRRDHVRSQ